MKHPLRTLLAAALLVSPAVLAQPADKTPPAAAAKPTDPVKLLDPGVEPRRTLRYTPTKGDAFGFELRMKMAMDVKTAEATPPSPPMPLMVMGGDVKVLDVTPEGNAKVAFVYGEGRLEEAGEVPEQIVNQLAESMSKMAGMSGEFVFTNRGEYVSGEFKFPDGLNAMARQTLKGMNKSMEQFTAPLPLEPVGKGAIWSADRVQDTNGLKLKVAYTQELTQLSEKFFSLKTTIKGETKNQKLSGITIDSLTMSGDGDQQVDFARMMPRDCHVSVKSNTTMDANGGMSMDMTMTMSLKLTEAGKFKIPASETAKPVAPDKDKAKPKF